MIIIVLVATLAIFDGCCLLLVIIDVVDGPVEAAPAIHSLVLIVVAGHDHWCCLGIQDVLQELRIGLSRASYIMETVDRGGR